jgi:hypothetical protein
MALKLQLKNDFLNEVVAIAIHLAVQETANSSSSNQTSENQIAICPH